MDTKRWHRYEGGESNLIFSVSPNPPSLFIIYIVQSTYRVNILDLVLAFSNNLSSKADYQHYCRGAYFSLEIKNHVFPSFFTVIYLPFLGPYSQLLIRVEIDRIRIRPSKKTPNLTLQTTNRIRGSPLPMTCFKRCIEVRKSERENEQKSEK